MKTDKKEADNVFDWAVGKVLGVEDFNIADKVALIEGFVFSESITLIYSPPKQGKTWLGYAIAKRISEQEESRAVYYLDMDNSLSTLKERKIHQSLILCDGLYYLTRGTIGCDPIEQLEKVARGALRGAYEGVTFVLDTTKDFVDTDSKTQASVFMSYCVRIRDAGGTVIILHHATKNERRISGNSVFTNTSENVYQLRQIGKMDNTINYELKVTHARGLAQDCRWSVDTKNLTLSKYNVVSTGLTTEERVAVDKAVAVLAQTPAGLSTSKLVESMGFARTHRRGRELAVELVGKYWQVERKSKNNHIYHCLGAKK